jgi:hypothetical protein
MDNEENNINTSNKNISDDHTLKCIHNLNIHIRLQRIS